MSTLFCCLQYLTLFLLLRDCCSTFIDSPATGSALTNAPTTLECLTHDEHPLPASVVWFKDNVAKSSDDRILISYNSSTGHSTYNILSVLYADDGVYRCEAYSSTDSLLFQSDNGTLTVMGKPAFDPLLKAKSAATGSTVTLDCNVVSNPSATVSWAFKGVSLTASTKISFSGDELTITNAQTTDSGLYTCTATNSHGSNSTSATLTVQTVSNPDVYIQQKPLNNQPYAAVEGDKIHLLCTVDGEGISNIQWKKVGSSGFLSDGVAVSSDSATLTFTSIVSSDEGGYQCSANTSSGGYNTDTIQITVGVPPVLQLSDSVVTKSAGDLLSTIDTPLCIITDGDGNITVQWLDNENTVLNTVNNLEPGNFTQPTIFNVFLLTTNNGDKYTCRATNSAGTRSISFTLDVQYAPSFDPSFINLFGLEGSDVSVSCDPDANPPATTAWTAGFGGEAITIPHSITGTELTIFEISGENLNFQCEATNDVGESSLTVIVIVQNLPSVDMITPSGDFTATLGSEFDYSCIISGPEGTTPSLYHNGVEVVNRDGLAISSLGGTLTMTIDSVSFSDAGEYQCRATYQNYTATETQIMSIVVSPSIVTGPSDINVTLGETPLLSCTASGIPTPEITWHKTDLEFNNALVPVISDGISFRYESTGLRLLNPVRSHSGTYTCTASNEVNPIAQAMADVLVQGEPSLTSLSPTSFVAGDNATLTCELLFKYPSPMFNWTQGDAQTPVDPNRFTVYSNGDLVISPVVPEDHQSITCTAYNSFGSSSITEELTIYVKPVVSFSRKTVSLFLNSNLTATCSVLISRPESTLELYLPSGSKALGFQFDPINGVLNIDKVTPSLRGTYTCSGTNQYGTSNDTMIVTVMGSPPTNITISSESSTTATISWLPPSGSLGDSLLNYQLRYWRSSDPSSVTEIEEGSTEGPVSLLFTGLEEYTEYVMEIRGVYEEGIISEFVNSSIITLQDVPSGPPRNITLTALVEAIQIEWQAPELDKQNGVIEGYNIWYRTSRPINTSANFTALYNETYELIIYYLTMEQQQQQELMESAVSEQGNGTSIVLLQYNVTGLNGGTSYDVVLQAFTTIGVGPGSDITSIEAKRPFPLTAILASVVPVGTLIIAALLALLVIGLYFCIRKLRRMRKFSIMAAQAEEGRAKKRKGKKKRKNVDISDPMPEYPPDVDTSKKKSKFTLHHEDGSTVPSHPKVIKPSDVAKKRKSGAQVVSKKDSVVSDPYEDPDAIRGRKKKGSKRGDPKRDGFAPRDSGDSRIYEEPEPPRKKKPEPPPPYRGGDDDDDEVPDEVPVAFDWGSGGGQEDDEDDYSDEEEQPKVVLRNKKGGVTSRSKLASVREESDDEESEEEDSDDEESESEEEPPQRSRRKRSDQQDIYASVSDKHKAKKRSKMMQEKMKQQEKEKKEKEKMAAKKKKEQMKLQKMMAAEKKKQMKQQMKEQKRRESLGLGNVDMDMFGRPSGGRGRRASDVSAASLF